MPSIDTFFIPLSGDLQMQTVRYSSALNIPTQTPVICLHGLTRNAADFEDLAPKIAACGHDVYAISFRGRGKSDRDPNYLNYVPQTYCDDILALLDNLDIERAIFIGTSLGGIVTMLLSAKAPHRIVGAILNDIGPELAPEGIARIAGYVGGSANEAMSLDEATACIKSINEVAFPDASHEEWQRFAKRTFQETDLGWVLDYDPNIARALLEAGPAPDLWAPFESLKQTPTLIIRGALSDLLSPEIVAKMRNVHPNFDYAEIPRVGHAPMLTEPHAWRAIEDFLAKTH